MLTNVEHVLDLADERVGEVEQIYQATLREQEVPGRLQALIREAIVGYRSALERVANAVAAKYGISGRFVYWPNASASSEFAQSFDTNLPGLRQSHPLIAQTWERYQAYQPGYEWVAALMTLYRREQHHDFTPQTRTEQTRHVDADKGGVVSWDPQRVKMSGGVFIHGRRVNPATQMTANTEKVIYVDWLFADTGESALGTLRMIKENIRPMLHDIASVSDL